MSAEEALAVYKSLPAEARQRVDQLLIELSAGATRQLDLSPTAATPIEDDPFIGMWRDRHDLADSTGWVRGLRTSEWSTPRG